MASEFISKKKIGEILIAKNFITPKQLSDALEIQKGDRQKRIGELLIEAGLINEEILARALATQYSVPYFDASTFEPDKQLMAVVPEDQVQAHQVLPYKLENGILTILTHDPVNLAGFQMISRITGYKVAFLVAQKTALTKVLNKVLQSADQMLDDVGVDDVMKDVDLAFANKDGDEDSMDSVALDNLKKQSNDSAIVQLVNKVLLQAITERTSDIHIEGTLKDVLVRFRIDGELYDRIHIPKTAYNAVLSRVKIMCDLDITERHIPQDGGFKVQLKGKNIDFRVSILPSIYGQNVCIRILGASGVDLKISELGFSPHDLERFEKGIYKPYGWVLVTGPTGSGKTTTLYSSLSTLNSREAKIITVEDPVEYKLPGIQQTQVRINKTDPEKSLTFAKALRSILRHDPDIVMIGEIRDFETAEIAIQAALTGHLVFATLHTNTAVDTIGRLQNIGIDTYLFAAALNVIVAQRLIRKICKNCKEPMQATREQLIAANLDPVEYKDFTFQKGKGCTACNGHGVLGRQAVHEVLLMSDTLRQMVIDNASLIAVRDQARKEEMQTLWDSTKTKVLAGNAQIEDLIKMARD